MSYSVEYRNAKIVFSDKNDWEENNIKFEKTKQVMNDLLDNLKIRLEDGVFDDDMVYFFRVAPSDHITTYIGLTNRHNPYIFSYDARNKTVSEEIPYSFFEKIGMAPYIYVFEDIIKDKNTAQQKALLEKDVLSQLKTLSNKYDERIKEDNDPLDLWLYKYVRHLLYLQVFFVLKNIFFHIKGGENNENPP